MQTLSYRFPIKPVTIAVIPWLLVSVIAWASFLEKSVPKELSNASIDQLQLEASAADSQASFAKLLQAAKQEQPQAQQAVGQVFLHRHDDKQAIYWLNQAAAQGNHEAQFTLGKLYFLGSDTTKKNYITAHYWFAQAARAHFAPATYYMGLIYKNGYGQPVNATESVKWFEQGAKQNQAASLFMLANAYRAGEGVPQNDAQAVKYYQAAAELEHPEAIQTLAMAYQHGEMGLKADASAYRQQVMEVAHSLKHPAATP